MKKSDNERIQNCLTRLDEMESTLVAVRASLQQVCFPSDGEDHTVHDAAITLSVKKQKQEQQQDEDNAVPLSEESNRSLGMNFMNHRNTDMVGALTEAPGFVFDKARGVVTDVITLQMPDGKEVVKGKKSIAWATTPFKLKVPVFHPESKFVLVWLLVGCTCVCYDVVTTPIWFAFDVEVVSEGALWFMVTVINCYFLLDIVLSFFTGYVQDGSTWVISLRCIATRYLQSWFLFDVLAGIPWEWLPTQSSGSTAMSTRLFRMARLLRFAKLASISRRARTVIESRGLEKYIGLMRYFCIAFTLLHWLACIWTYLGRHSSRSWVTEYLQYDPPDDLPKFGEVFPDDEVYQQYTFAIYFVLMTMTTVGFGDITPTNFNEVIFTTILLVLSCLVFAGLTGHIMSLFESFKSTDDMLAQRKSQVAEYMKWRNVPKKLRGGIQQYLSSMWDANRGYEEIEEMVKTQLSPVLRIELFYHLHGKALESAPFLAWMKDFNACIKLLSSRVSSNTLDHGDVLFHTGQENVVIHILNSGKVWISQSDRLFDEDKEKKTKEEDEERRPKLKGRKNSLIRATSANLPNGGRSKSEERQKLAGVADATLMLKREDFRMQCAARILQRHWRRRHKSTDDSLLDLSGKSKPFAHVKALHAKRPMIQFESAEIVAPAYFGESCLWVPRTKWDVVDVVYQYTATCISRVEVLIVPRAAVSETIMRFSPWLGDRLDFFRHAVIQEAANNGNGMSLPEDKAVRRSRHQETFGYRQRRQTDSTGSTLINNPEDGANSFDSVASI